jgi:hypothetical protein
MKTVKNLLKTIFVASFILLPSFCFAQVSLSEAISKTQTQSVPFLAKKTTKFGRRIAVENPNNVIPDRLYENVHLTQYTYQRDWHYPGGTVFRKFNIPNSSNQLLAIEFGESDYITYVLVVVSPTGQVLSTLEAAVFYLDSSKIAVKQFRIDAQSQIVISTIRPNSTMLLPFETFTSFSGQRIDNTYTINAQGRFVHILEQRFNYKTYTRSMLNNNDANIWQGGETVESTASQYTVL